MGTGWTENKNEGWFPDGFEAIPFGARIDAVAHFLGGLLRHHAYDPTDSPRGAEEMLDQQMSLWEANLSGFGYEEE